MISQSQFGNVPGYGYNLNYAPREAVYTAQTADAGIAPDQTGLAPAPAGGDVANFSTASNLAPAPEKKPVNWLAWGAAAAGVTTAVIFGGKAAGFWLKEAGEEVSKQTKNLVDEVAEQFSHLKKGDLNNFSKEELEQLKNAKNKTEADKLFAGFKKAGEEAGDVKAPKTKTPKTNVPDALKNIDPETSDVRDIRKALKQHEIDLRYEATELADELEGTFDSNKRRIDKVNPGFDLKTQSKIPYNGGLPAVHEIDEASDNLITELEDLVQNGADEVQKAQAKYQLENGSHQLIDFNAKNEPIYTFKPKPLFSEEEKYVINLHNAGRETEARKLAEDLGFTHTPAGPGTPASFKNGGKEITLPSGKANDYVAEVTNGRAFAFDEKGNPMTDAELQTYLAECKKEKEPPNLNVDGYYITDGPNQVPATITVNTGSANGTVKCNPVA
jgi:hypothetical protein